MVSGTWLSHGGHLVDMHPILLCESFSKTNSVVHDIFQRVQFNITISIFYASYCFIMRTVGTKQLIELFLNNGMVCTVHCAFVKDNGRCVLCNLMSYMTDYFCLTERQFKDKTFQSTNSTLMSHLGM